MIRPLCVAGYPLPLGADTCRHCGAAMGDVCGRLGEALDQRDTTIATMLAALEMVLQRGRIDDSEERMNVVAEAIAAGRGEVRP